MDTGIPSDGARAGLIGRRADVGRLHAFLEQASTAGGALLLSGDPGIGKTVLLGDVEAAASAAGSRVLRTAGSEFLTDLSFSTLASLLQPLKPELSELDDLHREAVTAMLGLQPGPVTDQLLAHNAVLALVRRAATERPLLIVVDDAHWADRATAALLGFVARRLASTRIGLLAAFRPGVEGFFDRSGLPRHDLAPLADGDAATLLATRFPTLGARATQRVLAEAEGNPLALLELPLALAGSSSRPQLTDTWSTLPLSGRLQSLYSARVRALPSATQHLLLLAALEGTGDLATVLAAAGSGAGLTGLGPAEHADLVRVEPSRARLAFHHPLVRSTVVEIASDADRATAHRCLAEALADDTVRHARHLAEASLEPDEDVAALLEEASRLVLQRGDALGAFSGLLQAADLSPDAEARSRRLAEAAYLSADVTGELGVAAELLVEARRADPSIRDSLRAAVAAAHLQLNAEGDVTTAHRLLVTALDRTDPARAEDPAVREGAILLLLEICLYGGRLEFWQSFREVRARHPQALAPVVSVVAQILSDPARVCADDVLVVEDAIDALQTEADPTVIEHVATAAYFLDRAGRCRQALWRVVEDGRSGGAIASAIGSMTILGAEAYYSGQWDLSAELAAEGLEMCTAHAFELFRWPFLYSQGLLAAARGDDEAAERIVHEIDVRGRSRGMHTVTLYAHQTAALAALGRGEHASAFERAAAVCTPGDLPPGVPQALLGTLDLVEAAVGSGHHAEAAAHVVTMERAGITAHAPRLRLLTVGAAALTADGSAATKLFSRALSLPGAESWPFDMARVQLLLGEHLRRNADAPAARDHLSQSLSTFRRLGAAPWAARAAAALRASGEAPGRQASVAALTAPELEIARLAAAGRTNKEIGAQLYLSHRTVGAHLYRIFPKLGITSRAALRDALAAAGDAVEPPAEPARPPLPGRSGADQ